MDDPIAGRIERTLEAPGLAGLTGSELQSFLLAVHRARAAAARTTRRSRSRSRRRCDGAPATATGSSSPPRSASPARRASSRRSAGPSRLSRSAAPAATAAAIPSTRRRCAPTSFPAARFELDRDRQDGEPGYYVRACFRLDAGETNLADGGFTDWTARLLGDAKSAC